MTPPAGHVSIKVAAVRLEMSIWTLRRRIASGLCPVRWIEGTRWVPEQALPAVPRATPAGWRQVSPKRRKRIARERA